MILHVVDDNESRKVVVMEGSALCCAVVKQVLDRIAQAIARAVSVVGNAISSAISTVNSAAGTLPNLGPSPFLLIRMLLIIQVNL